MGLNKLEKGLLTGLVGGAIIGALGVLSSKYVSPENSLYETGLLLKDTGTLTFIASLIGSDLYFLAGKK